MARVLIIEDEPDVLLLLQNRVRSAGHEVDSATDGESGLSRFVANQPDLVILDWMMPKRDGIEVCEEIRAADPEHRTRVLMLTARSQQDDINRAYAAGADDYIIKPFSSRDLIDRIAALLAAPSRSA